MSTPLRVMIFDTTYRGLDRLPLSHAWQAGGAVYAGLGRIDHRRGVRSWEEALDWLLAVEPDRPLGEVQFWGHGHWGEALVDRVPLDRDAFRRGHRLHDRLRAIADRSDRPQWWFRTCETLGARRGHDFAQAVADHFGGSVAGHTHVIGVWQSGLHRLEAGERPHWSDTEGVAEGTADAPGRALGSWPWRPRTIHCLQGRVPAGW